MADSTLNQITRTDNIADDDLLICYKTGIGATRSITVNSFNAPMSEKVGNIEEVIPEGTTSINPLVNNSGLAPLQPKELETPLTISGVEQTTVETALSALNVAIAAVQSSSILAETPRFLRFNAENKKGLIIKKGTIIKVGNKLFSSNEDTAFDLSEYLTEAGKDYFVYLSYNAGSNTWTVSANLTKSADTSTTRYIGRLHTLCVSVPANTTMIMSCNDVSAGNTILVKPYTDSDPDFKSFYSKTVLSVQAGARASGVVQGPFYDVATVPHPLAGFNAGDILPESVWCLTFRPDTRFEDAMVYEKSYDKAIDIYLQSGKGMNTRSAYNATHTTTRPQICHVDDMFQVGKQLLSDDEFTSAALGSNECTNIQGSSDKSTVGGHVDTAGKRMISAIGCEEMCGYLWQWLRDVSALGTGSAWTTIDSTNGHNIGTTNSTWYSVDGQNKFGQMYQVVTALLAGGSWGDGSNVGSRSRDAISVRSHCSASFCSRGSSRVIRNA